MTHQLIDINRDQTKEKSHKEITPSNHFSSSKVLGTHVDSFPTSWFIQRDRLPYQMEIKIKIKIKNIYTKGKEYSQNFPKQPYKTRVSSRIKVES